MARGAGQLDKAERTYRALLLVVRRTPPGDDESGGRRQRGAVRAAPARVHSSAKCEQAKELLESGDGSGDPVRCRGPPAAPQPARARRRRAPDRGAREATRDQPRAAESQARMLGDMAEALDHQLKRPADALDALIKAISVRAVAARSARPRARAAKRHRRDARSSSKPLEQIVDRPAPQGRSAADREHLDARRRGARAGRQRSARRRQPVSPRRDPRRKARRGVLRAGARRRRARRYRRASAHARQDVRARRHRHRADAATSRRAVSPVRDLHRQRQRAASKASSCSSARSPPSRAGRQAGRLLKRGRRGIARRRRSARDVRARRAQRRRSRAVARFPRAPRRHCRRATPQQIREAVDLAVELAHEERAEALLVRAVAAARDTVDGLGSAPWAVLALAERRLAANDVAQARDLDLRDRADRRARGQIDGLAMRIATRALAHRKIELAADVYEFLRERSPADRAVWQPLLAIYRELGDGDRLGSVVSSTLPNLVTRPSATRSASSTRSS